MPNEQPQTPPRRRTQKRPAARGRQVMLWLLVLVAAIVVTQTLVGDPGLTAMLQARQEYDRLAATINAERAQNARLRSEVKRLKEDPRAIEEVARRDLGLIRAGEKVFIVKDVQPAHK